MTRTSTLLFRRLYSWRLRRRATTGGPAARTRLPGRPVDDSTAAPVPMLVGGDELRARALLCAVLDGGCRREGAGR
ncbi:hypothetical protein ACFY1C_21395 [Streptomyces sp. NPDC001279]|uniref:hypothetical protein n=1 Tax=Streptomyces sp. NPDC001279 TaxID=3364556 RepID=UPI0036947C10